MDDRLDSMVGFARRLVQTPSMSFEEEAIAGIIAAEMRKLDFDQVWQDRIGNVFGRILGSDSSLGSLVLNSHMDHVDPGEPDAWSVNPYSATVADGRIFGRGACDVKGSLAVQIYAMAALKQLEMTPKRDIVFSGVVQEEVGGAGAKYWIEHLDYPVDLLILGEPSENQLSLGHRGIIQLAVKFSGRSVHASAPEDDANPNYAAAAFLNRLLEDKKVLSNHPILGDTTVAPTILHVDTQSTNVTPTWTRVALDFRTASESPASLLRFIENAGQGLEFTIEPIFTDEDIDLESEAPLVGYYTPPDLPAVNKARSLIGAGMLREPGITSYQFATDGRYFVGHGMAIIGYAPGEEKLAHTANESIPIAMMEDNLRGLLHLLTNY